MKKSPIYQFVFRVMVVFALTAALFLSVGSLSSAQDETIGTLENPIKIVFDSTEDPQVIIEVGGIVVNYLEQETGLSFELNVSPSTAATVEDMCASPDDSMSFLHSYSYVFI